MGSHGDTLPTSWLGLTGPSRLFLLCAFKCEVAGDKPGDDRL